MSHELPTYEDILSRQLQKRGALFFSIIVLDGPDIIKFIAPPSFMDAYLKHHLYNQDPTLTVPQSFIGFYSWSQFQEGKDVFDLIKNHSSITHCESLVLTTGSCRLVLTVGYRKPLSLSQWFFEENPNFDHLFALDEKVLQKS